MARYEEVGLECSGAAVQYEYFPHACFWDRPCWSSYCWSRKMDGADRIPLDCWAIRRSSALGLC